MQDYIKINENDNVAVALRDINSGEIIEASWGKITITDNVVRGHKFALYDISENETVIKYGYPIGHATKDIKRGEHVHVHNIMTNLGDNVEYSYNPQEYDSSLEIQEKKTFMGYERKNKTVGVRNELWIVPTVGCVNSIAKAIEYNCRNLVGKNIDAVVAFNHPYGCSQMGDDQENTREALSGIISHPNAAGVLVLGLGCENSNIDVIKSYLGDYDSDRIRFLVSQESDDEVEEGVAIMKELAALAAGDRRTAQPLDKLVVGLKCGGSDGFSGITANPTVGVFTDILTQNGGTAILTEVPEMFGAETMLMDRAESEEVFQKTVSLINDFKDYYRKNNQTIYENPSPGNKAGGISTLEDKSLGCTQKSGTSKVTDVLKYGEKVKKCGLNLLAAPGNDLVASTALAVSGAQIILFTTGRGTPFASVVPTVKISTNSQLAVKKEKWIDFDCGILVNEGTTLNNLGQDLFDYVIKVAEGELVKSEKNGYRDLAIFKQGVTL